MKDLVSIIVAVYNVENDLEQCITSICDQTYKNLQIILIDDGSTDHSSRICDKWANKDSRITVKHIENGGVSHARNEGILCARGTYIAFVDSDDWVERDYIDSLVRNHKNGTLTCCGYVIERVSGKGKTKCRCVRHSNKKTDVLSEREMLALFHSGLFNAVWNKLYEASLIKEKKIRFPAEYSLGEDFMFNFHYFCTLQGTITILNFPYYHYIIRKNGSLSQKYCEGFYDIQKTMYENILAYLIQFEAGEEQLMLARKLYFNALIVSFDNLYVNRKKLGKRVYRDNYSKLVRRNELPALISDMTGLNRYISSFRWQLICHKLFPVEFYLRTLVKKLMGLE